MKAWTGAALVLAAVYGALPISAVQAETIKFQADMVGSAESPPNDSTARGHADVTFDTEARELGWNVVYDGLTGPAMGAHIHGPAAAGSNAGIMIPFPDIDSPITGSAKLNDAQIQGLTAGKLYVNIHTEKHPGGEIRGQLMQVQ